MLKSVWQKVLSVLAAFVVVIFAGCSNGIDEKLNSDAMSLLLASLNNSSNSVEHYGSITVSDSSENSRSFDVSTIKYAKVVVSGDNISAGSEPTSEEVSVVSGKANSIVVNNIPVGKNRIITVYGYDSSKNVIQTVIMRAVADISAGVNNNVSVDKTTTALGNVFDYLNKAGVSVSAIDKTTISNVIDSTKHYSLIASDKIAADYKNNNLKTSSSYVLDTATLSYKSNYNEAVTIQVFDRLSEVKTDASGTGTITGIAPGTYKVAVIKNNIEDFSTYVTFESGKTTDVVELGKVVVKDKIIVHAYGYTHIWAWNSDNTSENYTGGTWPGAAMTQEGSSSWYTYTIEKNKSAVIFSNGGSNQTANLSRTEGEYWFKNGSWYDSNPERPQKPEVTISVKAGTYISAKSVSLTSTNGTDSIFYTLDGSDPDSSSTKYTAPITISSSCTLSARAFNAEAETQWGSVAKAVYVIDADADLEAPVITANKATGRYKEALSDISFTITDNKSKGFTVYYTTNGDVPTKASSVYAICNEGSNSVTGKKLNLAMNENMTVRMLAVDKAGNEVGPKSYYYAVSDVSYTADRWDPRQESIYFLLTARWFDGDANNTIGDMNCSWTEARANDSIPSSEDGFTGPEDVTWRGDFKGLVEKMDYIKSLGFTCIWLTPVVQNRSPLCYHGYHAWNMYKEDARLVSEGYDFQRVIDEAHARGMKICLDIVINHSGRFGLENFAEIKYNRNPANFPVPQGWENFTYDEAAYQAAYSNGSYDYIGSVSQNYPFGWRYDGLHSAGKYPAGWTTKIGGNAVDIGGTDIPAWADFVGDVRPFTANDKANYPALANATLYNYPSTESYCKTIDDVGTPGSLTIEGYKSSGRRIRGHNTGFPTGSGSFDNFPDTNLDSLHEDCPDLNIENPAVQDYIVGAYNRYIDMGVDMFRVDTVMHMTKETLNDSYWPRFFEEAATAKAKEARGGGDFFVFGEVANFVNNLGDKPAELRQSNYVWDNTVKGPLGDASNNHLLNGNEYRTIDKTHKAVPESDYVVSCIDIVSHNGFCDGVGGAYGRAVGNSSAYWDASYLAWYTDSHDYGPNKGETRWKGDFAGAWSMLFTFRGIPIVYYGSEIRFAEGKPNDWPGGGANGVNMSLEKTGRAYYGPNLEGTVTASDFGEYTASGAVATTLNSELSKHLRDLNRIRLAVPALQMGQYSTEGHTGGWAGYKRRYTGTNKITGQAVDSYALVGVGAGTHSFTGVLAGEYVDIISGQTVTANGGSVSVTAHGSTDAALVVLVKKGLTTEAPGKVCKESPYLGF